MAAVSDDLPPSSGTKADASHPWEAAEGTAEERMQRSLFGGILDWMLVPLLLLWPLSMGVTYIAAKSIANQPFDQALEDRVAALARQVKERDGRVSATLSVPARDLLHADGVDELYFQIAGPDGAIVDGDRELPSPRTDDPPQPWSVQVRNATIHNTDVRIAYTWIDLARTDAAAKEAPRMALVQIGETLEKRSRLASQIIKGVILPEFILLPIALGLVWLALSRGLSPLADLQRHISERRPDDLSPIEPGKVPEEISPLVRSLNDMLARLSHSIRMQKRFIADAAHQMKTPLAGMRTQSELALRQTSQEEIHRSLEQLAQSSKSATRLVNQLLALARAENPSPGTAHFVPIELSELARTIVQEWVPAALQRDIDIGFEHPGHAVMVSGNQTMLREMLGNLIDNALRYTPPAGRVTIRVRTDDAGGTAVLEVEDTGPGIPASEREHVFERFYRILGSNAEGSGLGLAIVREIAQQHGAEVTILDNPACGGQPNPGALFRVSLNMHERTPYFQDIG